MVADLIEEGAGKAFFAGELDDLSRAHLAVEGEEVVEPGFAVGEGRGAGEVELGRRSPTEENGSVLLADQLEAEGRGDRAEVGLEDTDEARGAGGRALSLDDRETDDGAGHGDDVAGAADIVHGELGGAVADGLSLAGVVDEEEAGVGILGEAVEEDHQAADVFDVVFAAAGHVGEGINDDELGLVADDLLDQALCAVLDRMRWGRGESAVVEAQDPFGDLREINKVQ